MSCNHCNKARANREHMISLAEKLAASTGLKYVVYKVCPATYNFIEKSIAIQNKMNWIYETVS